MPTTPPAALTRGTESSLSSSRFPDENTWEEMPRQILLWRPRFSGRGATWTQGLSKDLTVPAQSRVRTTRDQGEARRVLEAPAPGGTRWRRPALCCCFISFQHGGPEDAVDTVH